MRMRRRTKSEGWNDGAQGDFCSCCPGTELRRALYGFFAQYGTVLDVVALKTPKMRGQAFVAFKVDAQTPLACSHTFTPVSSGRLPFPSSHFSDPAVAGHEISSGSNKDGPGLCLPWPPFGACIPKRFKNKKRKEMNSTISSSLSPFLCFASPFPFWGFLSFFISLLYIFFCTRSYVYVCCSGLRTPRASPSP
jgi:hypothetical protein